MPAVTVRTVVSPVFGAACHLVAVGADAVVVDPGAGVASSVLSQVAELDVTVHAVLATHGHPDHTWDAGPLTAALGAPFLVHEADAWAAGDAPAALTLLAACGPASSQVAGALRAAIAAAGVDRYVAPEVVESFRTPGGRTAFTFGSLGLDALHAPGHTPGSTVYVLGHLVLSGDVLFAGSVGRTDLPGADPETMAATLRDVVGGLDPALRVLPGHGPATTVARELATNPFLRPSGG